MSTYLFRAGSNGQHEQKFLDDSQVYLTWYGLLTDLSKIKNRTTLRNALNVYYPNEKKGRITNWLGQIFAMSQTIKQGDWVILPSKRKSAIHIGEVTGDYVYNPEAEDPYHHSLPVKWLETDIPRTNFDQDILYSLGAFMTVCRISRNDAEKRIRAMQGNNWKSTIDQKKTSTKGSGDSDIEVLASSDLEQNASDQIAKYIIAKFKGYGMERLVEAILKAKGYFTHSPPKGADKGVDIIAGKGPLGFEQPKIVVQVKTSDTPVDRPTLDQLVGTIQNFRADYGLLVSWSGFKQSVDKEMANQFFKIRLWDQQEIINQLLENYEALDEELRVELPLKRVWVLGVGEYFSLKCNNQSPYR